jgi:hypothetical protein
MATCLTQEGIRTVKLIRAVKAAGLISPGGQVQMLTEQPATYIGPFLENGIQMHEFRLFDGMEVALEVPALTEAMQRSMVNAAQSRSVE